VIDGDTEDQYARFSATNALPPIALTPDLRDLAVIEAKRIETARCLAARAAPPGSARPIVTTVRMMRPQACCAWVVPVVADDDEWVWQTVIGAVGQPAMLDSLAH